MDSAWMDRFGGVASSLCALHCLALSVAPALLSAVGLSVLSNEAFEWGFFAMAIGFAVLAAAAGFRVHHSRAVLAGFGGGVALLAAGRAAEALELFEGGDVLSVAGGLVLVGSHVFSMRRTSAAKAECCE